MFREKGIKNQSDVPSCDSAVHSEMKNVMSVGGNWNDRKLKTAPHMLAEYLVKYSLFARKTLQVQEVFQNSSSVFVSTTTVLYCTLYSTSLLQPTVQVYCKVQQNTKKPLNIC